LEKKIMNTIKIQKLLPPGDTSALQPLREVGSEEKTQFWDLDDIYEALREAHRLGLPPEKFFHSLTDPDLPPNHFVA
jgi:hypothetical protein